MSDARASVAECDSRFDVDEWWSAEWLVLREWVEAELQTEGADAGLVSSLEELAGLMGGAARCQRR